MAVEPVRVVGLADLRKALREADKKLPRELNKALKDKAAKPVADRGASHAKGRIGRGIKPFAVGNRVGVRGNHPGSGVHEFAKGTFQRRRHGKTETVRWSDPTPTPRNIWRAAEELERQIGADVMAAVEGVAKANGWLR